MPTDITAALEQADSDLQAAIQARSDANEQVAHMRAYIARLEQQAREAKAQRREELRAELAALSPRRARGAK